MKNFLSLFKNLVATGIVFSLVILSGSIARAGVVNLWGWNNSNPFQNPEGIDISGQVGSKLEITGPKFICSGEETHWTAQSEIVSGVLPPGLKLNDDFSISGVPTQPGEWYVILKLSKMENVCGRSSPDFMQGLHFHITSSSTDEGGSGQILNVKGWDDKRVFFDGVSGHEGTVGGLDINGEVGHPLSISSPSAQCAPSGRWVAKGEIVTGTLPPGLTFNSDGDWTISGIPKERGHWIVTMKVSDVQCHGTSFMGFTQQLRFHITGSGKVVE